MCVWSFNGVCIRLFVHLGYARPVTHTHEPSPVHGDIKCSNLLLDGHTVKLCDFGLCVDLNEYGDQRSKIDNNGIRGTPLWMAPEKFTSGHQHRQHRSCDACCVSRR
jgi:serine/threonine protein kinase